MMKETETIEIEFKTLLNKDDYQKVCQFYHLENQDFFTQKNIYYDTKENTLKDLGAGLRIRLYADRGEATLKTPLDHGLLETTDQLSLKEAQAFIDEGTFLANGAIVNKLANFEIKTADLQVLAELTTKRAEFPIDEGLLAIDENWYSDHHDFELELEVQDAVSGKKAFELFLNKLKISYQPALNKIQRAVAAYQKNKH